MTVYETDDEWLAVLQKMVGVAINLEEKAKALPLGVAIRGGPFDGCPAYNFLMQQAQAIRKAMAGEMI